MYEYEREELVKSLERKGISDENVLNAIRKVERHLFVPDAVKHHAYNDNALPIGYGQTISQPFTVAYMTQVMELQPGMKVLEIGTGSGYQAALLYEMGMKVFTIERNRNICQVTQKLFDEFGLRIVATCGDGTLGWHEYAPYDRILVTAGAPSPPKKLLEQLKVDGKMVVPVGDRKSQALEILTKIDQGEYETKEIPQFAFVPLVGKEGWKDK